MDNLFSFKFLNAQQVRLISKEFNRHTFAKEIRQQIIIK